MTELYKLIDGWQRQSAPVLAKLPTDTLHQRAVYWKAYRRMYRKTSGRAAKVAWHLFFKNENAVALRQFRGLTL